MNDPRKSHRIVSSHVVPANNVSNEYALLPLSYFKIPWGCFRHRRYRVADFQVVYHHIRATDDMTVAEKNLVLTRLNRIAATIAKRYNVISFTYTYTKLFVIASGILNPALLTLSVDTSSNAYHYIFWSVWLISLCTSLTTAFSAFLKIDRRYLLLKSFKTKVEQEIFLWLEGVGRYSIVDPDCVREVEAGRTFLSTKLPLLMLRLETLYRRMKQLTLDIDASTDEESSGNSGGGNRGANAASSAGQNSPQNTLLGGLGNTTQHPGSAAGRDDTPRSAMMPRHRPSNRTGLLSGVIRRFRRPSADEGQRGVNVTPADEFTLPYDATAPPVVDTVPVATAPARAQAPLTGGGDARGGAGDGAVTHDPMLDTLRDEDFEHTAVGDRVTDALS